MLYSSFTLTIYFASGASVMSLFMVNTISSEKLVVVFMLGENGDPINVIF